MARWLSTDEAASVLGYNREYVRRLVRSGRLKGERVANVWRVDKQSVDERLRLLERQASHGISKHDPRRGRRNQ